MISEINDGISRISTAIITMIGLWLIIDGARAWTILLLPFLYKGFSLILKGEIPKNEENEGIIKITKEP